MYFPVDCERCFRSKFPGEGTCLGSSAKLAGQESIGGKWYLRPKEIAQGTLHCAGKEERRLQARGPHLIQGRSPSIKTEI